MKFRGVGGLTVNSMENEIFEPSSNFRWNSLCSFFTNIFCKGMNLLLPTAINKETLRLVSYSILSLGLAAQMNKNLLRTETATILFVVTALPCSTRNQQK